MKFNDNNIRNDSVEYDSPSELNNFDEQKSHQNTLVILQNKTFTIGCNFSLKWYLQNSTIFDQLYITIIIVIKFYYLHMTIVHCHFLNF